MDNHQKTKLIEKLEDLYAKGYVFKVISKEHPFLQFSVLQKFKHKFNPDDQIMTLSTLSFQGARQTDNTDHANQNRPRSIDIQSPATVSARLIRYEPDFELFRESLVKGLETPRKFILLLNTCWIWSLEEKYSEFDQKVATFLLAVSKVFSVKFDWDLPRKTRDFLMVSSYTHHQLRKALFEDKKTDITGNPNQNEFAEVSFSGKQIKQYALIVNSKKKNTNSVEIEHKTRKTVLKRINDISRLLRITAAKAKSEYSTAKTNGNEKLENANNNSHYFKCNILGKPESQNKYGIEFLFLSDLADLPKKSIQILHQIEGRLSEKEKDRFKMKNLGVYFNSIWEELDNNLEYTDLSIVNNNLKLEEIFLKKLNKHLLEFKSKKIKLLKDIKHILQAIISKNQKPDAGFVTY